MKYKYKLNDDGKCVVCDFMRADYVLAEGEQSGETGFDGMPDIATLHSKAYLDAQALVKYKLDRQAEYPDMGTQLNKIYDDGITKWKSEMVDPIKAKYPKP